MHLNFSIFIAIVISLIVFQCDEADLKCLNPKKPSSAIQSEPPERCNTDFDAATVIRGELFLFKNNFMWRPRKNQDEFKIREIFFDLPADMTHVDSVFETAGKDIWFFIGSEIFVFNGRNLSQKLSLQDIGIDQQKYLKIDAIFRSPHNNRTYIFSSDDYWRLGDGLKVENGYPKKIAGTWKDVHEIDSAFGNDEQLYFFKGPFAYEFDIHSMTLNQTSSNRIGVIFMGCLDLGNGSQRPGLVGPPTECRGVQPNNGNSAKPEIWLKFFVLLPSLTLLGIV